jgi:DNA polymerase I-like protein with 3'-5' exonuclease and polymerase domains
MERIVFDIETDDYLNDWTYVGETPTCTAVGLQKLKAELDPLSVPTAFLDNSVYTALEAMSKADVLIGHNIISYDLPFLERFYGWTPKEGCRIIDTFVLSRLMYPENKPHKLEAWGDRFGIQKPHVDNFSKAGEALITQRVIADVKITKRLYDHLLDHPRAGMFKRANATESRTEFLMHEQAGRGVDFDRTKAEANYEELGKRMLAIEREIEPRLPPRALPKSQIKYPPKVRFLKSGEPSAASWKYFGEDGLFCVDGVWYVETDTDEQHFKLVDFDRALVTTAPMHLINRKDIKDWLLTQGWQPTFWNIKDRKVTSPKIQDQGTICPNLLALGKTIPDIKKITLWNTYQNRKNIIYSPEGKKATGLLAHPRLNFDGRLPAGADTLGAITRRMAHRVVANMPRTSSVFGREMREMFIASEGMVFVGWDAAGLEDRMKAHYLYPYDPAYANKLLDESYDAHDENTLLWFGLIPGDPGFDNARSLAKSGLYALTYGCSPAKLASTLKKPASEGQALYDAWWSLNEPLKKLKEDIEKQWNENGCEYLIGLDGAPITTRKAHALLNTLFQSAGIIVMKVAMVWWHEQVQELWYNAHQVIHYHDEAQAECLPANADEIGQLGVDSIKEAGILLELNVPLDGAYQIGASWADTH